MLSPLSFWHIAIISFHVVSLVSLVSLTSRWLTVGLLGAIVQLGGDDMVVDEYEQFNNNNSNDDDDADVVLVSPSGSVDEPEPEPEALRADDCKPSFDACPLNNKRGTAVRYSCCGAHRPPGIDRALLLLLESHG